MSSPDFDRTAHLVLQLQDGSEIPMDRYNTYLCTYLGKQTLTNGEVIDNSRFDHIAVGIEDESGLTMDNTDFGLRIFKLSERYEPLRQFITENLFPMILNETRVPPDVREAYETAVIEASGVCPDYPPDFPEAA